MENPDNSAYCKSCGAAIVAASDSVSPDVKKCTYCSKPLVGDDAYYFRCRYCDQDFCYEHRLPENHLCKSSPLRRNIPNSSSGSYYSTGGGYWASTGKSSQKQGGFSINVSKPGRNLAIAIVAGLVIGAILYLPQISGIPVTYYLVQFNDLVYGGWIVPLFTSMIVVLPSEAGILDVAFNAFAVVWLDGLMRADVYSQGVLRHVYRHRPRWKSSEPSLRSEHCQFWSLGWNFRLARWSCNGRLC